MTLRGWMSAKRYIDRITGIAEYWLIYIYIDFRYHPFFFLFQKVVTTRSPLVVNREGPRARISVSIISSISNAIERFCIRNLFHGLCAPARSEFNGTRHLGHIVRAFFKQRVREGQKVYLNSRCLSAAQHLEYAANMIMYDSKDSIDKSGLPSARMLLIKAFHFDQTFILLRSLPR